MTGIPDLLLVNAGGSIRKKVYQTDNLNNNLPAIEPPFWAALTAGFLMKRGYNLGILDANAENLTHEETAERIKILNPRLVDIIVYGQQPSASTQLMGEVISLTKEIKKQGLNIKIAVSGPHPSALPKRTLLETESDFVAEGEGFYTLLGLLENNELSKIPGLWYKENGEILSNPRADIIKDVTSELSDVAWDLLPMDKYLAHNWHCLDDLSSRNRYASMYTTLGCPFNCSFCCIQAPFKAHSYREFSPEWVLNQIDTLVKRYNVKNIKFIDELFVLNPEHFVPIADGLIKRNYGVNIWAYARIDTVKEEYLEKLKKAGFNWLALGIESGNEGVRKSVQKGRFDQSNIYDVVKKIKDAGINIIGNYMFGLPDDDLDTMQQTLNLAQGLNCEFSNFYAAMAYPGSRLYSEAVEKGLKLPNSWIEYSQHSYDCQPLPTNKISAKEVLEFRDYAFDAYHRNPRYLSMIEKKFGIGARKHIEEMNNHKLKRKLLGD